MYCQKCGTLNEDTMAICRNCGNSLKHYSANYSNNSMYVGFWIRFFAAFIDGFILNIITFLLSSIYGFLFGFLFYDSLGLTVTSVVLNFIVVVTYFAGLESSVSQATFGKQVMGIKVTDYEGNRISFSRAVLRYVTKIVTALMLGIGYLFIIFTEKKQGLYDLMAETVVVKK